MDFGELLHTAQRNGGSKPRVQYYSTKFTPPKKEQRSKNLSVNVQKFLARKEAEELKKNNEAQQRRDKLLELRSKDKKATRRVNVMLKRTKSANQSVIADALDHDNTAVTLAGPSQPDEDDYGYVSQESEALYNKMMEKYNKMPDEPKFPSERKRVSTNLSGTKDRVRAALEKEKLDAMLPHKRKRKRAESTDVADAPESEPERVEKKESNKPKFKVPPPMNFSDLLKIAEKKQFEPIVIEKKDKEEERPLTKKQRKEFEREREWRDRKDSHGSRAPEQTQNRIPKLNSSSSSNQNSAKVPPKQDAQVDSKKHVKFAEPASGPSKNLDKSLSMSKNDRVPNKMASSSDDRKLVASNKATGRGSPQNRKGDSNNSNLTPSNSKSILCNRLSEKSKPDTKRDNSNISRGKSITSAPPKDLQPKRMQSSDIKQKQYLPGDLRYKQPSPSDLKPKQIPPNGLKPKQIPPSDLKAKPLPPKDLKPKQFPPPDVRKKEFPPVRRKPMAVKKGKILDDDEEYDSEMDDFIDDGPEGEEDYSKYISEIFGYDKRKYASFDDDTDNMESTFAQQMREEVISTKIGIMEDLEDMKQEEEEKKRKAMSKKRGKL